MDKQILRSCIKIRINHKCFEAWHVPSSVHRNHFNCLYPIKIILVPLEDIIHLDAFIIFFYTEIDFYLSYEGKNPLSFPPDI